MRSYFKLKVQMFQLTKYSNSISQIKFQIFEGIKATKKNVATKHPGTDRHVAFLRDVRYENFSQLCHLAL